MAEIKDFIIDQGSTWQPYIVLSTNDVPNNLAGYTAQMQFRRTKSASVTDVSLTTENGGLTIIPAEGKISLLISAIDTGNSL